jgi:hypothetical protein
MHKRTAKRLAALAAAAALGLTLISAAACGGGGASVMAKTQTTTLGEELIDLNKAYEKGLLTTEEYEKQRAKLLSRPQ